MPGRGSHRRGGQGVAHRDLHDALRFDDLHADVAAAGGRFHAMADRVFDQGLYGQRGYGYAPPPAYYAPPPTYYAPPAYGYAPPPYGYYGY